MVKRKSVKKVKRCVVCGGVIHSAKRRKYCSNECARIATTKQYGGHKRKR